MYETGLLRQATGGPLRPGGLDLTARLLEMCSLPADAVILDAGCGSGATLGFLKSAGYRHGLGIDRSGPLLQADGSPVDPPLACAEGVAFSPGNSYFLGEGAGERFMRINFATHTPDENEEGIKRLAIALRKMEGGS